MSLLQTKFHLEKIIALYKSMAMNEKNITSIERDLMLQYVRNLYETLLTLDTSLSIAVPPPSVPDVKTPPIPTVELRKTVVLAPQPEPKPEPKIEARPEPKIEAKPEPKPEPKIEAKPEPKPEPKIEARPEPKPEPKIEAKPEPKPEPKIEARPEPKPEPKIEAKLEPKPEPKPIELPKVQASAEIRALFEEKVSFELSERLSQTPIADLTRAFSINDRLLNIKELFGGQGEIYHNTLGHINELKTFAQAENLLLQIAIQYNWTSSEDRQKQARHFVKVVRRRFK